MTNSQRLDFAYEKYLYYKDEAEASIESPIQWYYDSAIRNSEFYAGEIRRITELMAVDLINEVNQLFPTSHIITSC